MVAMLTGYKVVTSIAHSGCMAFLHPRARDVAVTLNTWECGRPGGITLDYIARRFPPRYIIHDIGEPQREPTTSRLELKVKWMS